MSPETEALPPSPMHIMELFMEREREASFIPIWVHSCLSLDVVTLIWFIGAQVIYFY